MRRLRLLGDDRVELEQVAPPSAPVTSDILDYDEVFRRLDATMEWLARTYVHAMNCIHYMHDKYFYERLEMALHDRDVLRTMAFGIAGLSVRDVRAYLEYCADQRLARLGMAKRYGTKNPLTFMDLQDVQEVTNFFERRVSAYQVGVTGDVVFDAAF